MGPLDDATVDPAVRGLIRQLIALLVDGRPTRSPVLGEAEQLLDVEVEGVRCRFVRIVPPPVAPTTLSPREREIARMVAKGLTNQAISDVLGISAWTVSTHLRRAFAKLGVNSRAAMVAAALDPARWSIDEPAGTAGASPLRVTHVRGSQEDATTAPAIDPVAFG